MNTTGEIGHMDDLAKYNKERWEELAAAGVVFSRPWLDLDENSARRMVDPEGMLREITGKDVLCLAGGGGQQSAAFALLGADVTVLDLSETQLRRDQEAASFYKVRVRTVQGDMRDLSSLGEAAFDVVWHAHSLNFVPDARAVFREVARVLRKGGLYRLSCWNPFVHGASEQWNGHGYLLNRPYIDAGEVIYEDPCWDWECGDGTRKRVKGPKEFRHRLSTLVNGLIGLRFTILGLWEHLHDDYDAEPGTWRHFESIVPPWLILWAALSDTRRAEDQ